MDPLTMGLVGGGASLLGSVFSSVTGAQNVQSQIAAQQQMLGQTEQFNAGQAELQRDYETQMSNTAYQRASADMKAAGLNPMMMFGSGSAAGTPSVGAASVGTPGVPMPQRTNPLAGIGDAVKSGLSSMIDAKSIDLLTQKVANMQADKELTQKQTLKQMQNITSDLPKEKAGQVLGGFMANHPDLTTAAEVTKYGAGVLDDVGSAAGSIGGGLLKGVLGKRFPSKSEDLSLGFDSTAKDKLRGLYSLPEARQKMKDLEGSFKGGE